MNKVQAFCYLAHRGLWGDKVHCHRPWPGWVTSTHWDPPTPGGPYWTPHPPCHAPGFLPLLPAPGRLGLPQSPPVTPPRPREALSTQAALCTSLPPGRGGHPALQVLPCFPGLGQPLTLRLPLPSTTGDPPPVSHTHDVSTSGSSLAAGLGFPRGPPQSTSTDESLGTPTLPSDNMGAASAVGVTQQAPQPPATCSPPAPGPRPCPCLLTPCHWSQEPLTPPLLFQGTPNPAPLPESLHLRVSPPPPTVGIPKSRRPPGPPSPPRDQEIVQSSPLP